MHKNQWQTMDKATIIDLGKSESNPGFTLFVCLSRAKRLGDLSIESMPFERLSKFGEKHTFQLRLQEEVRLTALAEETLCLQGGGVCLLTIHM